MKTGTLVKFSKVLVVTAFAIVTSFAGVKASSLAVGNLKKASVVTRVPSHNGYPVRQDSNIPNGVKFNIIDGEPLR